jgi:hypothetical protein
MSFAHGTLIGLDQPVKNAPPYDYAKSDTFDTDN